MTTAIRPLLTVCILFALAHAVDGQEILPPCKQTIVSFARNTIPGVKVENLSCKKCLDKGKRRIITSTHRIEAGLAKLIPCDETGIVDGAKLEMRMTRVNRSPGPCDVPVGHHFGTWTLFNHDRTKKLASGKFVGTESYNSEFGVVKCDACDEAGRLEGSLTGKGNPGTGLEKAQITLTYTAKFDPMDDHCAIGSFRAKFVGVIVKPN